MRDRCCSSRFSEDVSGEPPVGRSGRETGSAGEPIAAGGSVSTWVLRVEKGFFCARGEKKDEPTPTINTPLKRYNAAGMALFRPGIVPCAVVEGRTRCAG